MNQVSNIEDPDQLNHLSKVYGEEADRRRHGGQRHRGYELIRDVADYKARVRSLATKRIQVTWERKKTSDDTTAFLLSSRFWDAKHLRFGMNRWKFMNGKATMAIDVRKSNVYYLVTISNIPC